MNKSSFGRVVSGCTLAISLRFVAVWIFFSGGLVSVGAKASDTAATASINIAVSLPTTTGEAVELQTASPAKLRIVCFLGCECPLAKLYTDRLNQLANEFVDADVQFIGINSNPQDSFDELVKFAADQQLKFPLAKDHDATVMTSFGATRTPEVVAIDSLGSVVYRGRIDDQYRPGVAQTQPKRNDLREAIVDYLAGRPIAVPRTNAAGCLVAKPRNADPNCSVTYCGDVAAILTRHCIECHRAGEIGPFSLTQYDDVTGWADMILEVIEQKRMPPWHASADHVSLINERRMPQEDIDRLRTWVDGGLPYGDASKLPVEPSQKLTSGWQLPRSPDLVIDITKTPFKVVAEGVIEYQYFVVDPGFEEDVWVEAAEIFPGNRTVLHHAIAFIRPPDGIVVDGMGMLTAYVPGQRIAPVTAGLAKRVPAGSSIVFQMHYTPTGKEQTDGSKLGLLFTDKQKVDHELVSLVGINHGLEIPPGEAAVQVEGISTRLPKDGMLLSIAPHMHLRGKSVSVEVKRGDATRTILEVPAYDFNWQHTYLLREPIPLSDVDSITFTATYDNSTSNPSNPDPSQFVTWGDQTWEEMAVVFYEVAKPLNKDNLVMNAGSTNPTPVDKPISEAEPLERHRQLVDELMKDLDRNADGLIQYDEPDLAVKRRLYRELDLNRDREVDRDEVLSYVQKHR